MSAQHHSSSSMFMAQGREGGAFAPPLHFAADHDAGGGVAGGAPPKAAKERALSTARSHIRGHQRQIDGGAPNHINT